MCVCVLEVFFPIRSYGSLTEGARAVFEVALGEGGVVFTDRFADVSC